MAYLQVAFLCATFLVCVHANLPRPKPLGPSLGLVIPTLQGWGWSPPPPTTPPPPTPGWPETEAPGWSEPTTLPPTTQAWTAPPTTKGWTTAPPTTGWPASGWGGPVELEIEGEVAVAGEGESGASHGSEVSVSGDASNPAILQIQSGSYSSLGQGSGIMQIGSANPFSESSTFQAVDGYNFGDSGEYFGGSIQGNQINTVNGGGSFTSGQGVIGQTGWTQNFAGRRHK